MQRYDRHSNIFPPSEAETQLADRLDRLSVPLAENVLRRAIDMHHDETFDDSIDWSAVEQIGAELGIDPQMVRKALLDELQTERDVDDAGLIERLFGPERVSGGIVVEASAETVASRLDEWMREQEIMEPTSRNGSTMTWESTRSPLTILMMLGALGGATRALRGATGVVTRQTDVVDGNQLIELSVDTSEIRQQAMGSVYLSTVLGVIVGVAIARGFDGGFAGLLGGLASFGGVLGLGIMGAVRVAKNRLRGIKQGINRALDGIVHLTTLKKRKRGSRRTHSSKPVWIDIVEEIFDEVFD